MARPPTPNGDTILVIPDAEQKPQAGATLPIAASPWGHDATRAQRDSLVAVVGKARLAWCALMPLHRLVTALPLV